MPAVNSDEREEWEEDPEEEEEPEDPAVTRKFQELETRQAKQAPTKRRPARRKPRSTAWIALILLLASIYVFWVLPYQLGSRPVRVEFSQDKK